MIPKNAIHHWHKYAPWHLDEQVEQDLILSKSIIDLYSDPFIQNHLALRGDTALQKLYFESPCRYSEDFNLVQIKPLPIDAILDHVKNKMHWLGNPFLKMRGNRITLYYKFPSTINEAINLRITLEINIWEHSPLLGIATKNYCIKNPWICAETTITTYHLEELLAIKMCKLYQRKKGRDLFDLYNAMRQLNPNIEQILNAFNFYLQQAGLLISRADFEENLFQKLKKQTFLNDINTLSANESEYKTGLETIEAMQFVHGHLIAHLPGEPWTGDLASHLHSLT